MTPPVGNSSGQRRRRAAGLAAVLAGVAASLVGGALGASAVAPKPTAPPTVEGKFQVGETLAATAGTWASNPTQYMYAWLRCNSGGWGCAAIAGAAGKHYKLVKADVDHTVRVAVTAQNPDREGDVALAPARFGHRGAAEPHARPDASGSRRASR